MPSAFFRAQNSDGLNEGVFQFKKQKLSHDEIPALQHFMEFKDSTQPWSKERAQLTRDLFNEMHLPVPSLAHPSFYA